MITAIRSAVLSTLIILAGCGQTQPDESKIPLTEAELVYISSRPSITWAAEDNRPPYVFIEDGILKGVSVEYLKLISKKTGLKFEPLVTNSFYESLNAIQNGSVEILTTVRPSPELASYLNFTPPIAYNGGLFMFRVNVLPRSPLTVGVAKGSPVGTYLMTRFRDMKLIETIDDEESLSLLQKGLVDGSVMDAGTVTYFVDKSGIELRQALINFDYPYAYAYGKSDVVLGVILTKAIDSISIKEKKAINAMWIKEVK